MKAGFTEAGARAASSHTGRLAEVESAFECVFERAGVIRCESIKDQFDFARAFAYQPLPAGLAWPSSPMPAVPASWPPTPLNAKNCSWRNLLPKQKQILSLSEELSRAASINNPIDLLGDALADRYEFALRVVLDDPNVDSVLVLLSPHAMTACDETAEAVVSVVKETGHQKARAGLFPRFAGRSPMPSNSAPGPCSPIRFARKAPSKPSRSCAATPNGGASQTHGQAV
jgi:acetate---CoA ligase (ADP-forming)